MQRALRILALTAFGAFTFSGTVVSAQPSPGSDPAAVAGVATFYDSLAPHGDWIESPANGWSWAPRVAVGWRPYTRGQWVLTEQGWHWDSDEAFGWATFHYGRWVHDGRLGWLWTPGTEWAPAWVSWRHGNGFVGWAPLAPGAAATSSEGPPILAGSTVSRDYVFVNERAFLDRGVQRRLLPTDRNVSLIDATIDVTNYRVVDERVINLGVDVAKIERTLGRTVPRVTRADAKRADGNGGPALMHNAARADLDGPEDAPSYTNARVVSIDPIHRTLVIRTADAVEQTVQLDDRLAGFGAVEVGDPVILSLRSGPGWARVTSISRGLPDFSPGHTNSPQQAAPAERVDPEVRHLARTMFDSRVAGLAQQSGHVDRLWGEFVTTCKIEGLAQNEGARGWFVLWEGSLRSDLSGSFCRDLFNQIVGLGEPIKAGMTTAEDVARRSLEPGEMREIRRRHSMDWGGWSLPRPTTLDQ